MNDQILLQKFSQLPLEVRSQLSGPEFLGVVEKLEEKYRINLAIFFISLITADGSLSDLKKLSLSPEALADISTQFSVLLDAYKKRFSSAGGIVPSNKAALVFSTEDEEEVDKFKAIFSGQTTNYDQKANQVILSFGFSDPDEIIGKRLQSIIIARLRGVRDDLETLDSLKKARKVGGMEFSVAQADALLKIIKNNLQDPVNSTPAATTSDIIFPAPKSSRPQNPGPVPLQEKIQSAQFDYRQFFNAPEVKKEAVAAPSEPVPQKAPADRIQGPVIKEEGGLPVIKLPDDDVMVKPKIMDFKFNPNPQPERKFPVRGMDQTKPLPQPQPAKNQVSPRMLNAQQTRKPKLDDIRFTKKLVGPIEELEYMTLIDFRRLAENPTAAIQKVREKVDLLEKDSYGKRIEGVAAWHKNEVNKFYRLLGHKSIEEGVSIEKVISERLETGKPTLSLDEFNAIMELNKQLRF